MNRPWTNEFMTDNPPGVAARPIPVQVMKRTFFRGDRVEVMVGDDKGKQVRGIILIKPVKYNRPRFIAIVISCFISFSFLRLTSFLTRADYDV